MEITYIDGGNVRLKGKQVSLTTQQDKAKTPSDAVLLVGTNHTTDFMTKDGAIVFQGTGEYEIKGTKVTGFAVHDEVMYTIQLDGMSVFVGNVSSALAMKDKLHEHDIAVCLANDLLNSNVVGFLNARVLVFVGEKAAENMNTYGKESQAVSKYVITKDKLPQETEFVLLG